MDTCQHCGAPLTRAPTGRPRVYCSDQCRWYAWRHRHRERAQREWAAELREAGLEFDLPTEADLHAALDSFR